MQKQHGHKTQKTHFFPGLKGIISKILEIVPEEKCFISEKFIAEG